MRDRTASTPSASSTSAGNGMRKAPAAKRSKSPVVAADASPVKDHKRAKSARSTQPPPPPPPPQQVPPYKGSNERRGATSSSSRGPFSTAAVGEVSQGGKLSGKSRGKVGTDNRKAGLATGSHIIIIDDDDDDGDGGADGDDHDQPYVSSQGEEDTEKEKKQSTHPRSSSSTAGIEQQQQQPKGQPASNRGRGRGEKSTSSSSSSSVGPFTTNFSAAISRRRSQSPQPLPTSPVTRSMTGASSVYGSFSADLAGGRRRSSADVDAAAPFVIQLISDGGPAKQKQHSKKFLLSPPSGVSQGKGQGQGKDKLTYIFGRGTDCDFSLPEDDSLSSRCVIRC